MRTVTNYTQTVANEPNMKDIQVNVEKRVFIINFNFCEVFKALCYQVILDYKSCTFHVF